MKNINMLNPYSFHYLWKYEIGKQYICKLANELLNDNEEYVLLPFFNEKLNNVRSYVILESNSKLLFIDFNFKKNDNLLKTDLLLMKYLKYTNKKAVKLIIINNYKGINNEIDNIIDIYNNFTEKILCLTIVILIFLTNFLTFLLFHRLSIVMNNNYKNELLLQEANAKEQYYRQIEENNKIIQKIKHDLKNRLLALYAIEKNSIVFQNEFKKLLGELDSKENKIYTINPVINMILNNKFHVAKSLEIKIDSSILVPKKINLDYSDAGILLGNLLDNAIEACTKVPVEKRWISIDIIYQRHLLIVKICNSKDKRAVNIDRSSKLDFEQHGIGIQSVKNIVEKYNGAIIFSDLNEKFEVNAILYGIKSE